MRIPARGICVLWLQWTNSHDYRNPVEEKGWHGHNLSERGREGQRAQPLPGQAFIAFLGTLHRG